ncbi:MAG: hypothetical protein MI866_12735 [Bacteroidales bacterium]|nr:hypothetical protein [Bacteroidales bacterium]
MRRLVCVMVLSIFVSGVYAQTVEEILSKYTEENGQMYLQPFADAFSADFNSGLFHNAKVKKKGFSIYIGVVAQVATISNSAKYFQAYTDSELFPQQGPYKVPTVFGPTEGVSVPIDGTGGMYEYVFPGGFDVDYLPLAMPQITIGSLFGTDFTARYITLDVDDYGKIDVFGWGVRHSIDQYIPALPVALSVGYYNQSFKVGEYMDAKTNVVNLQTSITIPVITFYGGLGYETSKVDVQYVYEGSEISELTEPGDEIKFELEGANTIRATLGLCFNLGPVKIHGDYNMAKQNTFAVGLGIGINEN